MFCLLLMSGYILSAQASLNEYKYVIIPKKFNAFKKENEHMTSTYLKHLFTEGGFNAIYDDALPDDLIMNRCLGLLADVNDNSSMFTTKIVLVLKDCTSKEIFSTKEGSSKSKEYKEAFREAFDDAFVSFRGLDYRYKPKQSDSAPITVSFKNDVKNIDVPTSNDVQNTGQGSVIKQEATIDQQSYKDNTPVVSNIKNESNTKQALIENTMGDAEVWYAQVMPYGYQLVDSTPKVQMQIYKSSNPDIFMAKKGDQNGLLFGKNGTWFFEYYEGANLRTEQVYVKF